MAVFSGPNISKSNIILYFDSANRKSYIGSGTAVTGLSSVTNDGTLTNGPTFSTNNNGILAFDGQDDYISVPSSSRRLSWAPAGSTGYRILTFEVWVKTTDTAGQIFSKPWNGSGVYNYRLDAGSFYTQIVAGHTLNFTSIADGNWKHVVAIANETQKAVYVNGAIAAAFTNHGETSDSPSSGDSNIPLSVMTLYPYGQGGGSWPQTTHAVQGELGMFKIYSRQLSAAEILQNFEATKGRYGL